MGTKFIVTAVAGLALAAAAVTTAVVLPARAEPAPAGVIGIGKVQGDPDAVKRQIQEGRLVYVPPSDPTFNPEPTSPPDTDEPR